MQSYPVLRCASKNVLGCSAKFMLILMNFFLLVLDQGKPLLNIQYVTHLKAYRKLTNCLASHIELCDKICHIVCKLNSYILLQLRLHSCFFFFFIDDIIFLEIMMCFLVNFPHHPPPQNKNIKSQTKVGTNFVKFCR